MAPRPSLKGYFRPLRRGGDAVQLGLSAESGAVILSGLTEAEMVLLERLDGSLTEARLYAAALADGVTRVRVELLLGLLRRHGLLRASAEQVVDRVDLRRLAASTHTDPSPEFGTPVPLLVASGLVDPVGAMRARAGHRVLVDGAGRLPWEITTVLRAGGTGRVDVGTWAADLLDADLRSGRGQLPDLVVLVAVGAVDPRAGHVWRRRGIPHLPVVADGDRVVIGPLVGRDPRLPCLRCLQLARADRDAEWPTLAVQSARAGRTAQTVRPTTGARAPGGAEPVRVEAGLVAVVSGAVALLVHAHLDGEPVPEGVSVEASLPWPRLDHRRWVRHPACTGHDAGVARPTGPAAPGDTRGPVSGAPLRPADRRVTMTR